MFTAIIFIIVLAILIFVHELGHFLVARWLGIRVDEFAIGFGPRIIGTKRKKEGETEYSLNLIPFGGYVKIYGENPHSTEIDPKTGVVAPIDKTTSFYYKPKWAQALVLIAGVAFNVFFAWILIVGLYTFGVTASVNDYTKYADKVTDYRILITEVSPNSPAATAGLKPEDVIESIEETVANGGGKPVLSVELIRNFINNSSGKPIKFNIIRGYNKTGADRLQIPITVLASKDLTPGRYAIGISMAEVGHLELPFNLAIVEGTKFTYYKTYEMIGDFGALIGSIFGYKTGVTVADVSGPIGIASVVGSAARTSFAYLVMFTAIISLNLAIINIIPFPALDGGRLLFVIIESVIRREIPPKVANAFNIGGFALLMLLMVVVTFRDIVRLF